jgi:methylthioribose-1-phosphate isomerase
MQDNIPVKLITDNMSGFFMRNKQVDAVVVGADRIASNGDVANKIGTYMVAVMAQKHNIPFYVAAPISTLDLSLSSGDEIPIEQRSGDEVACLNNKRITPEGAKIAHPAFDITPNDLVTAIITDRGIAQQSYSTSLKKLAEQ